MSSIFKNKKGLGRGLSSLIGDTKAVSKKNHHNIKTIIAPRHINRVEEIQNLCKKYHMSQT